MKKIITIAAILLATLTTSSHAADNSGWARRQGPVARIGIGTPASFELGAGYQFSPNFVLTVDAFSYSGLTAMSGIADARYYFLDKDFTPFIDMKAGYGVLGKNLENQSVFGAVEALSAGVSWKALDLSAGFIHDSFHGIEYSLNLTWTIRFRR